MQHIDVLRLRLSHERERLASERQPSARELRRVWIAQIEREIGAEMRFLGLAEEPAPEMTDDQLLAELLDQ